MIARVGGTPLGGPGEGSDGRRRTEMATPRFAGRRALVTGAGAGFGRAAAVGLARGGAATVALVERYRDRLDEVCAEIDGYGARPVPIAADLRDAAGAADAVTTALEEAGGLDIVISNHVKMGAEVEFVDSRDEDWDLELAVNLTSHYVLARNCARAMRDAGRGGSIAFTASVDSLGAEYGFTSYCVTKAGLVAMARVMAVELAKHGIRVNCVSPGPGDTQGSLDLVGAELMERYRREGFPGVPLNRLARVDDIAEAFLFLSSDAASYITGHNLVVDGGLTAFAYRLPDEPS
jgi:NAD(P)-dependent dehydrogenase (short-subunit alcohol dehydrogenase family)